MLPCLPTVHGTAVHAGTKCPPPAYYHMKIVFMVFLTVDIEQNSK